MANWEKLNKEFDDVLNNISDAEWKNWYDNIESQKELNKLQMTLEAKMQLSKINFSKAFGDLLLKKVLTTNKLGNIDTVFVDEAVYSNYHVAYAGESNFALAA